MIQIRDKKQIEKYLLRFPQINFYHIGDLDDFFWTDTRWYGLKNEGEISAILLQYRGLDPEVFLAIENQNRAEMHQLIEETIPMLPDRFYSHLSPGYEKLLEDQFLLENHGDYLMMELQHAAMLNNIDTSMVENVNHNHVMELESLYQIAYPGNWFVPRMLDTKQYVGLRMEATKELIGVAGVHVYSDEYQVAALGNITVAPNRRGEGLGKILTAGICKQLLKTVKFIGLNVRADNNTAISIYKSCGFEIVAEYGEWMVSKKT